MNNHGRPDKIRKRKYDSSIPPEVEIQNAWEHIQVGSKLKLADGRTLVVFSPGTLNTEAGPDFINAKISIDGKVFRGNVEIHRKTSDFAAHGHSSDPAYSGLILHAVGTHDLAGKTNDAIPDVPVFVLSIKKKGGNISNALNNLKCRDYFENAGDSRITAFFADAGIERYIGKSELALKDMIANGTGHALLFRLFDCAGFKRNRESFASLLTRCMEYDRQTRKDHFESIIWGESGLLPDPGAINDADAESLEKIKSLWDEFRRLRISAREPLEWHRDSVRPVNSPERRIAMVACFIEKFSEEPLAVFAEELRRSGPDAFVRNMLDSLRMSDDYWDRHTSFESPAMKRPCCLNGHDRALTMLVDVIMPLLHAYIRLGGDAYAGLADVCIETYCCIPQTQSNRIFSNALSRWFESPEKYARIFNRAVLRQGVHHVYSKYCDASSGDCSSCLIANSISQQ